MFTGNSRLMLYAPNVHTGGGFVLLEALLEAWPQNVCLTAWLDERVRTRLILPPNNCIKWVAPSIKSRLEAEFSLSSAGREQDQVLCFHGLPPLLRNKASLLLFLQNRIYLEKSELSAFSWRTRQRLRLERFICHVFRHRIASFWVQTPSMARALQAWYGVEHATIRVLPFASFAALPAHSGHAQWDFIYVADGEAHKNHRNLVEAWMLLAKQGIKPSLALTLSSRDARLKAWIAQHVQSHELKISDLGQMPHAGVLALYGHARALIFPSTSESFGLPLIEARNVGLPILAGEMDFVRDVCEPVQSFDPRSPFSIARAVRRFLGQAELPQLTVSAAEFLKDLRQGSK